MAGVAETESKQTYKVDFYFNENFKGLKERLRVELAGIGARDVRYDLIEDVHDRYMSPTLVYGGFQLHGLNRIKTFLNDCFLNEFPVTKPQIILYSERRAESNISKTELKTVMKTCDLFPDIFASIAFRQTELNPGTLITKELERLYGISYKIDLLDKKELLKVYKESGHKNITPDKILPSMVYNGQEITGLTKIISSMNLAITETKLFKGKKELSDLEKRRVNWWKEEIISQTPGINHGDDVHEEKEYPK